MKTNDPFDDPDFIQGLRQWELLTYTTEELVEEVNRRTEEQIALNDAAFKNLDLQLDNIIINLKDINKRWGND